MAIKAGSADIIDVRHGPTPVLEVRRGAELVWSPPAPTYDASALALFARFNSDPSALRKGLINDLIVAGKDHGWWFELDLLQIPALGLDDPGYTTADDAHAGRRNWIADAHNATAVSSPTFTTDRGTAGNGSSSYLNLNYNPGDGGAHKYQLDDGHYGVYSRTAGQDNGTIGFARVNASNSQAHLQLRTLTNLGVARVNQNAGGSAVASTDGSGHFIGQRAASGTAQLYRNNTLLQDNAVASTAIPNLDWYALAENQNGSAIAFAAIQLAVIHAGGALDAGMRADFTNDLNTYLVAVGAA